MSMPPIRDSISSTSEATVSRVHLPSSVSLAENVFESSAFQLGGIFSPHNVKCVLAYSVQDPIHHYLPCFQGCWTLRPAHVGDAPAGIEISMAWTVLHHRPVLFKVIRAELAHRFAAANIHPVIEEPRARDATMNLQPVQKEYFAMCDRVESVLAILHLDSLVEVKYLEGFHKIPKYFDLLLLASHTANDAVGS